MQQEDAGRRSRLPIVSGVATLIAVPVVVAASVVAFFRTPGEESVAALLIGVSVAALAVALGHAARTKAHGSGPRVMVTVAMTLSYALIALAVISYATPGALFAIATWRTPPNYELTFELKGTAERPVTVSVVEQFTTTVSSNLKRLGIPHAFGAAESPRVVLQIRAPGGADMSRLLEWHPMTINLVHDQNEAMLAASASAAVPPDGWKIIGGGDNRLLVQMEPLLVDGVQKVEVVPDGQKFGVRVEFRAESRDLLARAIREHQGRRLAIVVDDQPYAAPRVNGEPPADGALLISGGFEWSVANDLVLGLRLGMYPVAFRVIEGHDIR